VFHWLIGIITMCLIPNHMQVHNVRAHTDVEAHKA
jgi:hypothetical protein